MNKHTQEVAAIVTSELLDLISELDNRLIKVTDVAESLIKIVESHNSSIRTLTNIVSANGIALSNAEKDLYNEQENRERI